ncbi:MAG: site-specific integrase [Polynucleobacter sp.]|uniref:tyrosine-type recombinase/integrase n=1 Tax=Limnobacter sp. TaxID=2003368 RepID=UPI0027329B0F|nr:site-specific integrase [Limnobacter sp.]MDP3273459.1 site-specific integrase [Limnobacter sp.]MDZ4058177.1 site-specific integrase [Polynucleobacter sp.]
MATFRTLANGIRAEVCVKGVRKSKLCATKTEAKEWASEMETLLAKPVKAQSKLTVADMWNQWQARYQDGRKLERWERNKIAQFGKYDLAKVGLAELSSVHVTAWRDERMREVSAATVTREWNLMSGICQSAIRDLGLIDSNPWRQAQRPPSTPSRTRIPSDKELKLLEHTLAPRIWNLVEFAIETGMRAGEICGLTWENVNGSVAHLPMTKNGHPRDVPLSAKAKRIMGEQGAGSVFNTKGSSLDAQFRRGCKKALIEGLHFHDLRALAATRMSKKLNPLQLAKMLGHKDLKMVMIYYRETAEDIAKLL